MREPTREDFLNSYRIDTVDTRGYFITNGGKYRGWYYLYEDGELYSGVVEGEPVKAFWPTREAAQAFYSEWAQ